MSDQLHDVLRLSDDEGAALIDCVQGLRLSLLQRLVLRVMRTGRWSFALRLVEVGERRFEAAYLDKLWRLTTELARLPPSFPQSVRALLVEALDERMETVGPRIAEFASANPDEAEAALLALIDRAPAWHPRVARYLMTADAAVPEKTERPRPPPVRERHRGLVLFASLFVIVLVAAYVRAELTPSPAEQAKLDSEAYWLRQTQQLESFDAEVDAACRGLPPEEFAAACRAARTTFATVVRGESNCDCMALRCGSLPVSDALSRLSEDAKAHPRYRVARADLLALEQKAVELCPPRQCPGDERTALSGLTADPPP